MELETMIAMEFRKLGLGALMMDAAVQGSFEDHLIEHCEGLFGGFHTDRFAGRLIRVHKSVRCGNTLSGRIAGPLINTIYRRLPVSISTRLLYETHL